MFRDRLRSEKLWDRIVTADVAALLITDGMAVGMSGFTRAGEAMAVPLALAERARRDPLKITLMT
ncbi:propionyl-CoA--succinate CoA transferase, partial [Rhizobium ruizarguesonis]